MGTSRGKRHSTENKMGDCAVDLEKTIMPVSVGGGIYDFSGTQANFCYADSGLGITKEEVAGLTKTWWDGSSDGWLSDSEFNALMKDYKPTIGGETYMALRRSAFGDGDSQHLITMKCKTPGSKKGAIVAHSDFTCVVGVFDEDKGFVAGPCAMAVQALMEAYKEAGY